MQSRLYTALCLLIGIAVIILYGQVAGHEYVLYDDKQYIYQNTMVQQGLTPGSIQWAFTTFYASNWHPVTWISHMLDFELFGLDPSGPHLVNVLFHALNVFLLFTVLRAMTGSTWHGFAVAALFAIHPIHVESVAWLAERKDVLSLFFGLLTVWSYIRFIRKPAITTYLPVAIFFALGLMSKPMLVTLPLLLLLLDYWPLQRYRVTKGSGASETSSGWTRLVLEKIPLLALSLASGLVTLYAQGMSMASVETHSLLSRITNALTAYTGYLQKLVWPADLAVIYPYPETIGVGAIVISILLLTTATVFSVKTMSTRPYVMTGWAWFLVAMVPMIGIVQVGYQAMADRYAYLPFIGLYMMLVWLVADVAMQNRKILSFLSLGLATVLMTLTFKQVGYWQDSSTLFEHALKVTERNYVAHQHLAQVRMDQGNLVAAAANIETALAIQPNDPKSHATLGLLYARQNALPAAINSFEHALSLNPNISEVYNNLGVCYQMLGDLEKSIQNYRQALELNPDYTKAAMNLEVALRSYRGNN